ncbi:MAG: penicillin acylase family protein [Halioglobus sp.]
MSNQTTISRVDTVGATFSRILLIGLLAVLTACSDSSDDRPAPAPPPEIEPPIEPVDAVAYSATLHHTEGGVPHVVAADWGSLGFGTGYSDGQDNFCITARNILKNRSQLSEFFGPGEGNRNSDYFYALLAANGTYDAEVDAEMEALFVGYAAGFNRYLRDTGVDNLPDPACQGADWIQPMSLEDVRRIHLTPAFLPNFAQLLFPTAPPLVVADKDKASAEESAPESRVLPVEKLVPTQELLALVEGITTAQDKGSNGVAIGRDLTVNQSGMLYTNPHLDPDLTFRFAMMHQIMPGVMNMVGANAYDRANVGFGTNGDVAWTNTVSASKSFAWYRLDLVPGDPFSYLYDGESRPIEPTTVTITVKSKDGSLAEESYTFYSTHYGPMLGLIFQWGTDHAYSLRIADEGARNWQGGAIALARSRTVRELKAALNEYTSSPGINTLAADTTGEVLYSDSSPTPNFSDSQLVDCVVPGPAPYGDEYLGNGEACEWQTDADSSAPGLVGGQRQPYLYRNDYVTNSNDDYWLANPNEPVTGYPLVYGVPEEERTLRTRSGLMMMESRQSGTDGLAGTLFDTDSLLDRMLSNQHFAGQVLRDDLVTLCNNNPTVTLEGGDVDISAACSVLADWDLAANLDSRGSHLFREFMRIGDGGRWLPETFNYKVPFSADDPINTPSGLTADNPLALEALAEAVQILGDAGIPLDARLGDIQSVTRNGEVIPMHGGEEFEGVFNKMSLDFGGSEGYPEITGSSASWIMTVEFGEQGPKIKGVLSYSQSTNTESPHYSDMTKLFSNKELVDIPYHLDDVEAAATDSAELTEGTEQCAGNGWEAYIEPAFADEEACREYFLDVSENQITGYL